MSDNIKGWKHDPEKGDVISQLKEAPFDVRRYAATKLLMDGHSERAVRKMLELSGRQFKKAKRGARLMGGME